MTLFSDPSLVVERPTLPDDASRRTPSPVSALRFLYARTVVNRLRAQLARARSPRYLVAVVLGAMYLWWALFRNAKLGGGPLASIVRVETAIPVFALFALLSAARWWLFGSDRSALAFTPAEVQFLFPAPVSRRALVHAKLVRTQLAILLNTLIWSVLLRGGGGSLAGWRRGLALWVLFSVLALHRLSASFVRANALEHKEAGRRRSVLPMLVFGAMISAVVVGVVIELPVLRAAVQDGARSAISAGLATLQRPLPSVALWPARVVLEPVFATTASMWFRTFPIALGILLLHYFWVIRLDAAFEEAAMQATQHRADRLLRIRSSQLGKSRSRKGRLARIPVLALTGRPEVAIAWKNFAAAIRGGAWRTQLIIFTGGLIVLAIATRSASAKAGDVFLGVTAAWGAMLLFLGPLWMRFDLRLDLRRLSILKTWPLSGHRIVAAEIAGVTLLHSITVWSLMSVPIVMLLLNPDLWESSGATIPMMVAVAIAVPVFNTLMFTIQNGTVLLFPAWVRLGTEARGFETMGQNLLTTGATSLVAAVALVFPVGLGALIIWLSSTLDTALGTWAIVFGTVMGCIVLALEIWPVILWLGTVFDRTDVSDLAPGN